MSMLAWAHSAAQHGQQLSIHSYEGLPSTFSLAANMTAGAFAGIAVCSRDTHKTSSNMLILRRNTLSCTQ
jgi:hypothetical protein